jgi:hypothetical protein
MRDPAVSFPTKTNGAVVLIGQAPLLSNRSFDADTHRQGAAGRAGELTPRGALPVRAGQLRRYAAPR